MRVTIHLVSRADYWPLALATRAARRVWWLRATKGPSEPEMEAAAETLRAALEDGPMKRKAIDELLGKPVAHGIGLWLDMVRVPPSGTWERRRADLYGLAEDWVGPPDVDRGRRARPPRHPLPDGLRAGVEGRDRQLGRARPARRRARRSSGSTLRRFEAEDGTELLDLPDAAAPGRRTRPPRCASSAPGTPRCSSTPAAR